MLGSNVVVIDDYGEETLWGFEAEGPSVLMRAGIKNNALQPGDLVTVTARPLRDGRPAGAWVSVTKADGTFEIKGVPAGTKVNLVVWHEGTGFNEGGERGKEITLKEGDNDLGTIKIKSR